MIHGHKPAGYVQTTDASGKKIERELRQCCHCQYTWIYRPGSGSKRGFCLKCMGLLCGRKACFDNCSPFHDVRMQRDKAYRFQPLTGLYVRR
jgi:hypothetical protein